MASIPTKGEQMDRDLKVKDNLEARIKAKLDSVVALIESIDEIQELSLDDSYLDRRATERAADFVILEELVREMASVYDHLDLQDNGGRIVPNDKKIGGIFQTRQEAKVLMVASSSNFLLDFGVLITRDGKLHIGTPGYSNKETDRILRATSFVQAKGRDPWSKPNLAPPETRRKVRYFERYVGPYNERAVQEGFFEPEVVTQAAELAIFRTLGNIRRSQGLPSEGAPVPKGRTS